MGQAIVSVNIDMESIHELCEIFPQQIEKGRQVGPKNWPTTS